MSFFFGPILHDDCKLAARVVSDRPHAITLAAKTPLSFNTIHGPRTIADSLVVPRSSHPDPPFPFESVQLNVSFLPVKVPVTLPLRPSAQLMTPETREPSWVKMTSESPNPLPVVHHFPSFLSATPLGVVFLTVSFGALPGAGLVVAFGVVLVVGLGSAFILPPPGCA